MRRLYQVSRVAHTRKEQDERGQAKQAGRHEAGTQGESQRPVGGSTGRDSTGVDPPG